MTTPIPDDDDNDDDGYDDSPAMAIQVGGDGLFSWVTTFPLERQTSKTKKKT